MWPQTFNEPMTGYYNNSLDYQSNLMNGGNVNIYSNTNSVIKQTSPNLLAHSPISDDDSKSVKRMKKGHVNDNRSSRKVAIEKKRRDRINASLDDLRKLVPAANEKQGSAKLEKAEILQMTVDHLKCLHLKGFDAFKFDPHTFATKYCVSGFRECLDQVTQFLKSSEAFGFNESLKLGLVNHLQRYITQREYDLKTNSKNGLSSWNPNLFILPSTTNQTTLTTASNTPSIINTASLTTNAQQMLNSAACSSPITSLTPSLSNHSNSSIVSNSSSSNYQQQQQQINQQQHQDDSTSPLCKSPVSNNSSLNSSQLSNQLNASQLLNQHSSYTDNNNNNTRSTSNNSIHSESNNSIHSESNNSHNLSQSNNDERSNLLMSSNSLLMGPPPPPLQKVTVFNGVLSHSPNNAAELTYTPMSNMHPTSTNSPYSHHTHHPSSFVKMDSNQITTNNYAAYANHIHTQSYFNNLAYGHNMDKLHLQSSASVVANVLQPPNATINGQQYTTKAPYCTQLSTQISRPWNSEIANY